MRTLLHGHRNRYWVVPKGYDIQSRLIDSLIRFTCKIKGINVKKIENKNKIYENKSKT